MIHRSLRSSCNIFIRTSIRFDMEMEALDHLAAMRRRGEERREQRQRSTTNEYVLDIEMQNLVQLGLVRIVERRGERQRATINEHPVDPNPMPLHDHRHSNEYILDNTFFLPSDRWINSYQPASPTRSHLSPDYHNASWPLHFPSLESQLSLLLLLIRVVSELLLYRAIRFRLSVLSHINSTFSSWIYYLYFISLIPTVDPTSCTSFSVILAAISHRYRLIWICKFEMMSTILHQLRTPRQSLTHVIQTDLTSVLEHVDYGSFSSPPPPSDSLNLAMLSLPATLLWIRHEWTLLCIVYP